MKSKTSHLLVILLLVATTAWAQRPGELSFSDSPSLPSGAKGERVRSVLDAVNSGSPERISRCINENCSDAFQAEIPIEEHVRAFAGFLDDTGGVDFAGVRTYVPEREGETVVIVKDRNLEGFWGITFRFGPDPESLISGISFSAARPPASTDAGPLTEAAFVEQARALMDRAIARGGFSGAFLIARQDQILLIGAGGEAERSFHASNTIDTRFNLGSMNKMFTATAIMQLIELEKLGLDDPIARYIDESWLPEAVTAKITIRHLLTHSSGLGSYFNETFDRSSRALFRKLDDYKPLIRDDRPAFEPGSRFQYSNTGMFLLGVVIEKVTGMDYFDYVRQAIYEPAEMTRSDCYEMDVPVENLAIGYGRDPSSPSGWRNNLFQHVIKGGPAGGGFSTVTDLHRFALALLAHELVTPQSLELMWTDQLGASYGFGFGVEQGSAGKVVGHAGGFSGINAQLDVYPDRGYIVVVMSNVDSGASPLARRFGQLLGRVTAGS